MGSAELGCDVGWGLVAFGLGLSGGGGEGGLVLGGVANLGAGLGIFGMGADAEAIRLPTRLLGLAFFCCRAAAFCLASSCCCVCIAVQTLSFTSFHNASCASASAISNILIH